MLRVVGTVAEVPCENRVRVWAIFEATLQECRVFLGSAAGAILVFSSRSGYESIRIDRDEIYSGGSSIEHEKEVIQYVGVVWLRPLWVSHVLT